MDPLFALVFGGAGVYELVKAGRLIRDLRHSAGLETALGDVTDGQQVEVFGSVVAGTQMHSPLQGLACVWWRVEVLLVRSSRRRNRRSVTTALDVTSDDPFTVRTEQGDAHVLPEHSGSGADSRIVHQDQGWAERTITLAGRTHQIPSVAGGRRVVQETVIAPTQIVYVKGTVMTTPSGRWLTGTQADPVMIETDQPTDRRRRGMGRAALQVVIGIGLLVWAYFLAT